MDILINRYIKFIIEQKKKKTHIIDNNNNYYYRDIYIYK